MSRTLDRLARERLDHDAGRRGSCAGLVFLPRPSHCWSSSGRCIGLDRRSRLGLRWRKPCRPRLGFMARQRLPTVRRMSSGCRRPAAYRRSGTVRSRSTTTIDSMYATPMIPAKRSYTGCRFPQVPESTSCESPWRCLLPCSVATSNSKRHGRASSWSNRVAGRSTKRIGNGSNTISYCARYRRSCRWGGNALGGPRGQE